MALDPQSAIDRLYEVFPGTLTEPVEGCPCCITSSELELLSTTPLRSLSAKALEPYASSALLTVGSVEDLRYFWPRLVELSVQDAFFSDREIVFSKLRHGDWRTWPESEQRATEAFITAVLSDMATRAYEGSEVDEWVCAFSLALGDVTPHMEPLLAGTRAAAESLYAFHAWNARQLARGRLGNAFWGDHSRAEAAVVAWFRRPEVDAAITRAYGRHHTESDAPAG